MSRNEAPTEIKRYPCSILYMIWPKTEFQGKNLVLGIENPLSIL